MNSWTNVIMSAKIASDLTRDKLGSVQTLVLRAGYEKNCVSSNYEKVSILFRNQTCIELIMNVHLLCFHKNLSGS